MKSWLALCLVLFLCAASSGAPGEGRELIGRAAPDASELRWLGPPQPLSQLRGKVVLMRFWSDDCPMCASTLPGVDRLYAQHQKEGLVTVGVYHPKPDPRPVSDVEVRKYAASLGVHFPVAIDADWTVLKRWWLSQRPRDFTSVSFLVDRKGTIRWLHPGGELHPSRDPAHRACDLAWQELERVLAQVLQESG
jgi:peroxiredoxin